ncbi:MAG: DNA repair protein RadA [Actinomycetota bacterium]|nr:DNA repair protein RadA [Actinomycetota bacterium]
MAKTQTLVRCQSCGYISPKWMGKCPDCGEWNTMLEEVAREAKKSPSAKGVSVKSREIGSIESIGQSRMATKIKEFDRVLGGGIVQGSLMLLGGVPGIGKSTLLLQVANNVAAQAPGKVLIVSAEESCEQIKLRADRLGRVSPNQLILAETDFDRIEAEIEEVMPSLIIIDSIQTVYCPDITSAPGSISQVREVSARLLRIAKSLKISTFIVGHVTKDGSIAGPKIMEHIVDTVLYFEGDTHRNYRIIRAVKNRFGSTNEVGIFEMTAAGLAEVDNPSALFLAERPTGSPGSVVTVASEGNRQLLVEIQALTTRSYTNVPRRLSTGLDFNRFSLVLAVLEKRMGMELGAMDVFANVTGGIRLSEPATDLAVALAVASSQREKVIPEDVVAFGEVGLTGEVRFVSLMDDRIKEAARLGFTRVIMPGQKARKSAPNEGVELIAVKTIDEALNILK